MRAMSVPEMKALIAKSRAELRATCERDRWSTWVRACIVGAWAASIQDRCLAGIDGSPAHARRQTAPPLALVEAREPTCDAYLAAARAIPGCRRSSAIDRAVAEAADWAAANIRASAPAVETKSCASRHRELEAATASCR